VTGVDDATIDRHAWERPGAHEVAPGVHRIPLPLPGDALKAVNVYAIDDGDRLVLIDGGWAMESTSEQLDAALASLGRDIRDIREFLVTHMHRDHYTQAIAVRRITGSPVSLGEGEKGTLDAIHAAEVHPDIAHLYAAGAPGLAALLERWSMTDEFDRDIWEYPDRWLSSMVEIPLETRTLRVLATPGHTAGHVVFHDVDAGALFAGDHILPHITPSIGLEFNRPRSPLGDYLNSLRLIRNLPDLRLLPAHGPVAGSTHTRVDELLAHHDERLSATADAVAGGAATAFEVANVLGWTRHHRAFTSLDEGNQMMAVHETVAHLTVLVDRGELTTTVSDGVVHYEKA